MPPITHCIEITHKHALLLAQRYLCDRSGDLACDKCTPAPRRLVIEQYPTEKAVFISRRHRHRERGTQVRLRPLNSLAREHSVRLTIVYCCPVRI